MRLNELVINEGISLSRYYSKIVEKIKTRLDDIVSNGPYEIDNFKKVMGSVFTEVVLSTIPDLPEGTTIVFDKMPQNKMGEVKFGGTTVFLNVDLFGAFYNRMKNNDTDEFMYIGYNCVKRAVPFLLHELVHVIQYSRQQHRNGDYEYRSYSSGKNLRGRDDVAFDEYLSSPQEMTAFAHNLAIEIFNDCRHKERPQIDNKIVAALNRHFDNQIDMATPIAKRYLKLIYGELMSMYKSSGEKVPDSLYFSGYPLLHI